MNKELNTRNKITVLLAVHNRKEYTLASLKNLYAQKGAGVEYEIQVVLVDDGSTDGTANAIQEAFPKTRIIHGDGNLFWCGGMCAAYENSDKDWSEFYLLLNDDTFLYEDAISRALDVYSEKSSESEPDQIVIGSTISPARREQTYGGEKQVSSWHPLRLELIPPGEEAQACDTFNGNFVLVHRSVIEKIGFLDKRYTHQWGDTDYGLVAAKAGCGLWVMPGVTGECAENPPEKHWDSAEYSLAERIKMFSNVKGLPIKESKVLSKKHGGMIWPVIWLLPIIRGLFFPTNYDAEKLAKQKS